MPLLPLFSLWSIPEIQACERCQTQGQSSPFLGGTWAHFSGEPPASTGYRILLGRILLKPSCWCCSSCYRHQIPPSCPAKKWGHSSLVFEKQGGDTWVSEPSLINILSFIPSRTVPAGQIEQSPHLAAALRLILLGEKKSRVWCFMQQLPSSVSGMCCKCWVMDRRG